MRDTKNIAKHEFIGLEMQVISSSDPTHVGRTGRILDETRQTFTVSTENGEKRFAKNDLVFQVFVDGKEMVVEGNNIIFRPEDRPKRIK